MAHAYNNRGNVWRAKRNFARAIADFDKATALDPSDALARLNRATAQQQAGRLPQALADVSQALKLDPKSAIAHFTRGQIHETLGERAKAVADYRKAITLDPAYPEPAEALKRLEEKRAPSHLRRRS